MKITVITLFPEMMQSFFNESIIKRAQKKQLVEIEIIKLRDFAKDRYGTVDDRPYGGGAGMVLMVQPLAKAINQVKSSFDNTQDRRQSKIKSTTQNTKVLLTSPRGEVYAQKKAQEYSKLDHLIIIAGHYEGVDERLAKYIDEEVSLGDFVMTGGEITVAALVDSIVRLIPGVLKKHEATEQESFFTVSIAHLLNAVGEHELLVRLQNKGIETVTLLEYPHYTRPEEFRPEGDHSLGDEVLRVPEVLLSGNHAEIEKWRLQKAFEITLTRRKDLLER